MSATQESVRKMTVSDVMRGEVLAVEAGWSMDQLADFLVDKGISGAPVTAADGYRTPGPPAGPQRGQG